MYQIRILELERNSIVSQWISWSTGVTWLVFLFLVAMRYQCQSRMIWIWVNMTITKWQRNRNRNRKQTVWKSGKTFRRGIKVPTSWNTGFCFFQTINHGVELMWIFINHDRDHDSTWEYSSNIHLCLSHLRIIHPRLTVTTSNDEIYTVKPVI